MVASTLTQMCSTKTDVSQNFSETINGNIVDCMCIYPNNEIYTLSLHDALPIWLLNLGVQSEVVEEVGITIWWQSGLSSQYDSVARVLKIGRAHV